VEYLDLRTVSQSIWQMSHRDVFTLVDTNCIFIEQVAKEKP
jgi:hypothetical protein